MTQLTDKIREAIIGNVGTVISGRIGITDAEVLVKKFTPTFDTEDLTKMPNYQAVASLMINNVPSAPFSMSFIPPMGQVNKQLSDALKRLSAAKHGRPRSQVEKEIFDRLGTSNRVKSEPASRPVSSSSSVKPSAPVTKKSTSSGSSFLDEWLSKRKQLSTPGATPQPSVPPVQVSVPQTPASSFGATSPTTSPVSQPSAPQTSQNPFIQQTPPAAPPDPVSQPQGAPTAPPVVPAQTSPAEPQSLKLRGDTTNHDDEISIKLR
jgi:hypothetical protein